MLATWRVCCYMGAGAKWHRDDSHGNWFAGEKTRNYLYPIYSYLYHIFSFRLDIFSYGYACVLVLVVLLLLHSVEQKVIFNALVIVENSSTPIILVQALSPRFLVIRFRPEKPKDRLDCATFSIRVCLNIHARIHYSHLISLVFTICYTHTRI